MQRYIYEKTIKKTRVSYHLGDNHKMHDVGTSEQRKDETGEGGQLQYSISEAEWGTQDFKKIILYALCI